MQNLLRHLRRYTQRASTRSVYLRILYRFCKYTGCDPDELVKLETKRVQELNMDFVAIASQEEQVTLIINRCAGFERAIKTKKVRMIRSRAGKGSLSPVSFGQEDIESFK